MSKAWKRKRDAKLLARRLRNQEKGYPKQPQKNNPETPESIAKRLAYRKDRCERIIAKKNRELVQYLARDPDKQPLMRMQHLTLQIETLTQRLERDYGEA